MKEKRYRSVLKGFTWRLVATLTTFGISWIITGKVDLAISISAIEVVLKIGLFYLHERAWIKIKLGKEKPLEYEI